MLTFNTSYTFVLNCPIQEVKSNVEFCLNENQFVNMGLGEIFYITLV